MNKYEAFIFTDAEKFINSLPLNDKAKILASIKIMESDFSVVHTKPLRGPIKELIIKKYRILFFMKGSFLYFIAGFTKKTQKTPKKEIDYVEAIYNKMK